MDARLTAEIPVSVFTLAMDGRFLDSGRPAVFTARAFFFGGSLAPAVVFGASAAAALGAAFFAPAGLPRTFWISARAYFPHSMKVCDMSRLSGQPGAARNTPRGLVPDTASRASSDRRISRSA